MTTLYEGFLNKKYPLMMDSTREDGQIPLSQEEQKKSILQSLASAFKAFGDWLSDLFSGQSGEKRFEELTKASQEFTKQYDALGKNSQIKKEIDDLIIQLNSNQPQNLEEFNDAIVVKLIMELGKSNDQKKSQDTKTMSLSQMGEKVGDVMIVKEFKKDFLKMSRSQQKQAIDAFKETSNNLQSEAQNEKTKQMSDELNDKNKEDFKSKIDIFQNMYSRASGNAAKIILNDYDSSNGWNFTDETQANMIKYVNMSREHQQQENTRFVNDFEKMNPNEQQNALSSIDNMIKNASEIIQKDQKEQKSAIGGDHVQKLATQEKSSTQRSVP